MNRLERDILALLVESGPLTTHEIVDKLVESHGRRHVVLAIRRLMYAKMLTLSADRKWEKV